MCRPIPSSGIAFLIRLACLPPPSTSCCPASTSCCLQEVGENASVFFVESIFQSFFHSIHASPAHKRSPKMPPSSPILASARSRSRSLGTSWKTAGHLHPPNFLPPLSPFVSSSMPLSSSAALLPPLFSSLILLLLLYAVLS